MLNFEKTLVVAAHPDDETLGCGGLIAKLINQGKQVRVIFIAEGSSCRHKSLTQKAKKEIDFSEAQFLGATSFVKTRFLKRTSFWKTQFYDRTFFDGAQFSSETSFDEVRFF